MRYLHYTVLLGIGPGEFLDEGAVVDLLFLFAIPYLMGFNGCVPTELDEHITTEERKVVALRLSQQTMRQLQAYGLTISAEELNLLNAANMGSYWTQDPPITFSTDVGAHFILLLRGELPPSSEPIKVLP